ncbi:MAG: ribonuclease E/G, partial [Mycobacteriaceae bacterium]|nr:ribonuclease E/G [Mycobacteriaceae bacterium]
MIDGGPSSELSQESTRHEDLPDRLRVHSLARALGTTSRRVLDALSELDGRIRSAHSSVERTDAVRVRDLLATGPGDDDRAAPADAGPVLLAETPVERPSYMPLFVAPQPIPANDEVDSSDEATPTDYDDADVDDDLAERSANRRRRRGRRGRGRGRGENVAGDLRGPGDDIELDAEDPDRASAGSTEDGDDDELVAGEGGEDDAGSADASNRRRRRRRRRKSGSGDDNDGTAVEGLSPDDPPNTVVHERTPRSAGTSGAGEKESAGAEIQGIDGSTRLEAKRQRRRDGRDAGRRRPPVLSEAEFLARREAVERVMVVRDTLRGEPPHQGARYTQIAVLEDGIVVEHFVTSAGSASLVGNIYLGIV